MSQEIPIEFDGAVFVPLVPVDLPKGTRAVTHVVSHRPPPPMTDELREQAEAIRRELDAAPPQFPTLADAMRATRGRP